MNQSLTFSSVQKFVTFYVIRYVIIHYLTMNKLILLALLALAITALQIDIHQQTLPPPPPPKQPAGQGQSPIVVYESAPGDPFGFEKATKRTCFRSPCLDPRSGCSAPQKMERHLLLGPRVKGPERQIHGLRVQMIRDHLIYNFKQYSKIELPLASFRPFGYGYLISLENTKSVVKIGYIKRLNIIIMNLDYQDREAQNETATFNKIPTHNQNHLDHSLGSLSEIPESEQSPQGQSIALPRPLIDNPQHNNLHEFSRHQQLQLSSSTTTVDPNLTFHPNLSTRLLYDDKSVGRLKEEQKKLKEELRGMNEIVSEMLDKKYELVNEYQSLIKQKKCYKKLIKNLEQEYEAYQSMLQADYPIKLEEQIQNSAKQLVQLRKEVNSLNNELSKPLIKNVQQSDMKIEKLEKEVFETRMIIEKQKVATNNKKQQLTELKQKIKQKESNLKKINHKIDECSQLCEEEDLIPQQEYKLLVQKCEQTKIKASRLHKINELACKNKDNEYQRKLRDLSDKELSINNITSQVFAFTEKIKHTEIELEKIKIEQMIAPTKGRRDGQKEPHSSKKYIESRYERTNTPEVFKKREKYSRTDDSTTPFRSHTHHQQNAQNDYTTIESKAHRTMTEPSDNEERQQLNLRRKKIYTELQKNMYFKKIEHTEIEKLSRILQGSPTFEQSRCLQKQNSKRITLKLPHIRDNRPTPQELNNESIIEQSRFAEVQEERRQKKKSIQMHNKYIKQLKANRQALNRSNYQQLCNILNRDKLLIEQECEYEIGDLIYNSKF